MTPLKTPSKGCNQMGLSSRQDSVDHKRTTYHFFLSVASVERYLFLYRQQEIHRKRYPFLQKLAKCHPAPFVPYDSSTLPDPGYFEGGIFNSFGDLEECVNFLNKFYQCLVASKMPQKKHKNLFSLALAILERRRGATCSII